MGKLSNEFSYPQSSFGERQNALHLRQLDEMREFEGRLQRKRERVERQGQRIYNLRGAMQDVREAQRNLKKANTFIGRLTGRKAKAVDHLKATERNVQNISQRQAERLEAVDRQGQQEKTALKQRHQQQYERLHDTRTSKEPKIMKTKAKPLEHGARGLVKPSTRQRQEKSSRNTSLRISKSRASRAKGRGRER
jgi:hypothetical protein